MTDRVNKYNRKTSMQFGWTPDWFGCSDFDNVLTSKIKEYQKSLGLVSDVMLGPATFRRLETERLLDVNFDEIKKRSR